MLVVSKGVRLKSADGTIAGLEARGISISENFCNLLPSCAVLFDTIAFRYAKTQESRKREMQRAIEKIESS